MMELVMDELEWLSGANAVRLVEHVHPQPSIRTRKYLLLNVGCAWRLKTWFIDARVGDCIDRVERFADRELTEQTFSKWHGKLASLNVEAYHRSPAHTRTADAVRSLFSYRLVSHPTNWHPWRALCVEYDLFGEPFASDFPQAGLMLIRDVYGNPFRPVAFPTVWRTSAAVALARTMYDSRQFDRMPILADALEEAGCEVSAVLDHCRDPAAVHVRGCWVVDGVLGKT